MSRPTSVRLPEIFDDLNVGINLHDTDGGRILDANTRLAELYGYSVAELRSMSVGDYTAPSTRFTQEEASRRIARAAAGDPQSFAWQIARSNGELRWIHVSLNATTIDGVACVLSEVQDVTEYRARERRLRLLSRIVRHNLRNKTNVLMGYADRVQRAVEDDTLEREVQTILDISTEVGGLSDSVKQIERIAEPDATERSPTDLRSVSRSVIDDVTAEYPDADVSLEAPTEIWAIADEGIRYALEHAVRNAIKHNDRDVPTVTLSVGSCDETGHGVVRVADDGPAIPDVEIEVLNEDVETSSTYHGAGVGLWVMQWCVDSLGGELSFSENSPRGNVVTISLPRGEVPDDRNG
ncbi:PAS domain-containing sensor histidine kinase [Halorubrum salinum]|uniref:PAS domain-containing sensor histidine kinase n=1 Tax=Halorubrum salinum TaxID=767517 RepID=UPI002112EE8E|nr:PAS domain-containing sensor histidine kinase [Halorubrum salinum]